MRIVSESATRLYCARAPGFEHAFRKRIPCMSLLCSRGRIRTRISSYALLLEASEESYGGVLTIGPRRLGLIECGSAFTFLKFHRAEHTCKLLTEGGARNGRPRIRTRISSQPPSHLDTAGHDGRRVAVTPRGPRLLVRV